MNIAEASHLGRFGEFDPDTPPQESMGETEFPLHRDTAAWGWIFKGRTQFWPHSKVQKHNKELPNGRWNGSRQLRLKVKRTELPTWEGKLGRGDLGMVKKDPLAQVSKSPEKYAKGVFTPKPREKWDKKVKATY